MTRRCDLQLKLNMLKALSSNPLKISHIVSTLRSSHIWIKPEISELLQLDLIRVIPAQYSKKRLSKHYGQQLYTLTDNGRAVIKEWISLESKLTLKEST
jgi:predicted transcriptional regulator